MAKYEIYINSGKSKSEKNKETLAKTNNPEAAKVQNETKAKQEKPKKSIEALAGAAILTQTQQLASQMVNSYTSNIGARQDNISKQNRINNIMSTASETVSTVTTLAATGAAALAAGISAGPMVAIAGVALAAKKSIEIYNNVDAFNRRQAENQLDSIRSFERLGNITTRKNR